MIEFINTPGDDDDMMIMLCCQLLQRDADSATTWMQKLRLRTDRESSAVVKPKQKDSRRSHSVDSDRLLRPKTKSKTNKSPSKKSIKVLCVCLL